MSLSDHVDNLDPSLARALEQNTEKLREEFRQRLDETRDEMLSILRGAPEVEAPPPPPVAPQTTPDEVSLDETEELKLAVAQVDGATTQAQILHALVEQARRFCSRSAVFLTSADSLKCWGASGFDEATANIEGLELPLAADSAWARLEAGEGAIALSADDCAHFCLRAGVESPQIGLLLPFFIGDQVAAGIYADHGSGESRFQQSALQILTYVAAQTLETLPLRKRTSTATLRLAGPANGSLSAGAETAADETDDAASLGFESIPPPVAEPAAADEPVAAEAQDIVEPTAAAPPEPMVDAAPTEEPEPVVPEAGDMEPAPLIEEGPTDESPKAPLDTLDTEVPDIPVAQEELAPTDQLGVDAPATEDVEEDTRPGVDVTEPEAPSVSPLDGAKSSTLVSPPDDVQGPGWAFTTTRIPSDAGDEAMHEEARRLARLLVTEIKLYNEEQVETGRRNSDLLNRLGEDIGRSREIYEDRIEERIRTGKDYFREAMIRILAGGDEALLGVGAS